MPSFWIASGRRWSRNRNCNSIAERRGDARGAFYSEEVFLIFIYPEDLKAKAMLWLWTLRDIAVIGAGFLFSVLALVQGGVMFPMVATVLYAFLSIRVESASILDFLRYAFSFLLWNQQYYEWRPQIE